MSPVTSKLESFLIVDSVLRLHAYLLLRGWMYLYFVQLLHLLCWILIVFRPVLASFVLDLICILPLDLMHFARVDPWADKATQSSCLVVDYTYVTLHVSCIAWCIKSVPEVDTLYATGRYRTHRNKNNKYTHSSFQPIVDSVFRLHAYLLLRGTMYLYFVQFLHLLRWILFVFFHWIFECSVSVAILAW